MHVGYIVGSAIAVACIISGITILVKNKKNKWAKWLIAFGVLALVSAVLNYYIFDF